jgi:hypothetical protein
MADASNNESDKYANLTGKIEDMDKYVHQAYDKQIDWYWKTSSYNKQSYKRYRFWTIFLGALVTLIAALTTAAPITKYPWVGTLFTILTPVLAFILTVINTLSQNFQWGATWRDMVINASRLQKEKNRFLATKAEERDHRKELNRINSIVLEETQAFFRRILDTEAVPTDTSEIDKEQETAKEE